MKIKLEEHDIEEIKLSAEKEGINLDDYDLSEPVLKELINPTHHKEFFFIKDLHSDKASWLLKSNKWEYYGSYVSVTLTKKAKPTTLKDLYPEGERVCYIVRPEATSIINYPHEIIDLYSGDDEFRYSNDPLCKYEDATPFVV